MNKKEMDKQLEKVKKMAVDEAQKIKQELVEAAKKAQEYIKKNPEKATLIATGIGATVGAFLSSLVGSGKKKEKNVAKKKKK